MSTSRANFRRLLSGAYQGEVIVPLLRAALFDPQFKSFSIRMPELRSRPPDGWFHPSTHPLVSERLLYLYLTRPEDLILEPLDPHSTMAITQGHFWHDFIQVVGIRTGILRKPPPKCPCGCKTKSEWYVQDPETLSRGHMDGLLEEEVFEFKTMRPTRVRKIEQGPPHAQVVIDSYRALVPEYYAQAQEYMRLSGYRRHRTLILSMEYPFDMREIVMDADLHFQQEVATKYRRVIQAVADQRMPVSCCGDLTACPARAICKW